jgi:stringent starvation protein B
MYEWLVDNDQTPHLLIDATAGEMLIPRQFIQNDRIVLNIGPNAVRHLSMGNDAITFGARFGGAPMDVYLPPSAVLSIYSKETGLGMLFSQDTNDITDEPAEPKEKPVVSSKRPPKLTIVK